MNIKKFQLKNGMKVLFHQSHKSPVISVQAWVRTGSADEAKGEEGISHFIEHLVFKGTRKFKVGEIASQIEGDGGELNAYTSFDQTVFYVTISKQFVDTGIKALAEMMGFPLFDPTEIDNEREVVVEEIKRGQDSLGRRASQLLFSTIYKKHPYGIPVIGYEKNVRSWSAKKIKNYFHSRYSPQNMFLVVVGDFENKEMKSKVENFFGEFKPYKVKKIHRKIEPPQKTLRIATEKSSFEQSICYLSWNTPKITHKDIPALDVLGMIMGQGDSSRLVHKLRIESAIVNSVGSSVFSSQDPGFFAISMSYNKENLDHALSGVTEVLLQVLKGEIKSEEIKKSIVNISSENLYGVETVDGLSRKIGDAEFLMKDPNAFEKYLKAIVQVTAADLLRVAKKYLAPNALSAIAMTNDDADKAKKSLMVWARSYKAEFAKLKAVKSSSQKEKIGKLLFGKGKSAEKTELIILKNGVRILMRPQFDTQVISAKVALLGGGRQEPADSIGLSEMTARSWLGGTGSKTEPEIYHLIEMMAAGIGPLAGRNSLGLGLDCLAPFEQPARELFLETLIDPIFPEEVISREKTIQLEQIKSRNDNPSQIAIRQFMEMIFGSHPYGRDLLGTEQTLAKIDSSKMKQFWKQHLLTKNMTIILAGAFDQKNWVSAIEKATASLAPGSRFEKAIPVIYPRPETDGQVRFHEVQKEQSHLIMGFLGLKINDPGRFALQIMQSVLAGQGGRLFLELRDKKSLAYSVSPLKMEGLDGGYFGTYIGCSPDKVKKALEMMKIEFEKLCDSKISTEEMDRAKRYLAGRHDIELQRVNSVASSILYDDIYGIPYDETFTVTEKYFAVTSEQILELAQNLFRGVSAISLVGPNNPL